MKLHASELSDDVERSFPSVPMQSLAPVELENVGEEMYIFHCSRSGQQTQARVPKEEKLIISTDSTYVIDEIRRHSLAKSAG